MKRNNIGYTIIKSGVGGVSIHQKNYTYYCKSYWKQTFVYEYNSDTYLREPCSEGLAL